MAPDRRLATLLAFAHAFEVIAMDDVLDSPRPRDYRDRPCSESEGQKERLRTLRDLDTAALSSGRPFSFSWTSRLLMPRFAARPLPRFPVSISLKLVPRWRPSPAPRRSVLPELVERYQRVRRFLPTVFVTVTFDGTQAGQPLLAALAFSGRPRTPTPPGHARRAAGARAQCMAPSGPPPAPRGR